MNQEIIEIISQAIHERKPIQFEYVKEGKPQGYRKANPHILFSGITKEGIHKTWVHLVQTDGVSETLTTFPDWRSMVVDYMKDVIILREQSNFEIFRDYNPNGEVYNGTRIIAKV